MSAILCSTVGLLAPMGSIAADGIASSPPTICIDPGHPSEINSGLMVQNGTTETHIDWVVAGVLRKKLESAGYHVVLTKHSERELVRNRRRAEIANECHAQLMVRLHCDTGAEQGYAIYFPDRQGTVSGKSGPSDDVMHWSRHAATDVETAMSARLKQSVRDNGVRGDSKTRIGSRQGALTGSIFSLVPVVTIEMVVLSNRQDAEFIKTAAGQELMASAIADGIQRYVPLTPASTP